MIRNVLQRLQLREIETHVKELDPFESNQSKRRSQWIIMNDSRHHHRAQFLLRLFTFYSIYQQCDLQIIEWRVEMWKNSSIQADKPHIPNKREGRDAKTHVPCRFPCFGINSQEIHANRSSNRKSSRDPTWTLSFPSSFLPTVSFLPSSIKYGWHGPRCLILIYRCSWLIK